MSSDTRYRHNGDVHIAYRVFGTGRFDLVFASCLDFPSVEFTTSRSALASTS
jgi:hypothetical protein